jgi:hypothetical protein
MSGALERPRKRSPLLEDGRIVLLGIWGFLLQSFRSWLARAKEPHA